MKQGFRVLDSDIHVMEPGDLYLKHMDAKWGDRIPRAQGPRPVTGVHTFTTADGSLVRTPLQKGAQNTDVYRGRSNASVQPRYAEAFEMEYDAESMLKAMDIEGVDVAVIFRTFPLIADESQEPEYAFAIARAWNDWATDFSSADPDRLKVAAQIPLHDVTLAANEARRAVTELGHVGLCLLPEPIHGRVIHAPHFDPLWATAQEMDAPICVHPTIIPNQTSVGNRYIDAGPAFLINAMTQPLEDLLAVVSFCGGGILERFPRLRVAFLEGNCGWLPWLLARLDGQAQRSRSSGPMLPSEYFLGQCFISIDADETLGKDVIQHLGDGNLVFSTDWPHGDTEYPHATETLLAQEGLAEASKRKILWDNTARLYGL